MRFGEILGMKGVSNNLALAASVGSNELTVALKGEDGNDPSATNPVAIKFRDDTLTVGTPIISTITSAMSVVVPNTATLGTVNGVLATLIIVVLYNAGTPALGIVNIGGGVNLDETTLLSTTAIGTGADLATVVYSTDAISDSPFRVIGFINITEATAGTWATAPSLVQSCGGEALAAMQSIGYSELADCHGKQSIGNDLL